MSRVACGGGGAPALAPIDPVSGRVDEELRLALVVDDPSGAAIDLRVEGRRCRASIA